MNFTYIKFAVGCVAVLAGATIGLMHQSTTAAIWSLGLILGGSLDLVEVRKQI